MRHIGFFGCRTLDNGLSLGDGRGIAVAIGPPDQYRRESRVRSAGCGLPNSSGSFNWM